MFLKRRKKPAIQSAANLYILMLLAAKRNFEAVFGDDECFIEIDLANSASWENPEDMMCVLDLLKEKRLIYFLDPNESKDENSGSNTEEGDSNSENLEITLLLENKQLISLIIKAFEQLLNLLALPRPSISSSTKNGKKK